MDVQAQFEERHRRHTVAGLSPDQRCVIEAVTGRDTVKVVDCTGGTVLVRGKVKIILIDTCTCLSLDVVGAICGAEIVNCSDISVITGASVPMVAIDKSSRVTLELGGKTEIITASSADVSLRPTVADVGAAGHTIPSAQDLGLLPLGRQCLTIFVPGEASPPDTIPFDRGHLEGAAGTI